jgi:hypothetical protein
MQKDNDKTVEIFFGQNKTPVPLHIFPGISAEEEREFVVEFLQNLLSTYDITLSEYEILDRKSNRLLESSDGLPSQLEIQTVPGVPAEKLEKLSNVLPEKLIYLKSEKELPEIDDDEVEQQTAVVGSSPEETILVKKYSGFLEMQRRSQPSVLDTVKPVAKVIQKAPHYLYLSGSVQTVPQDPRFPNCVHPECFQARFSFLNDTSIPNKDLPPAPLYLRHSEFCKLKGVSKEDVFAGMERTATGELKCVDKEILDKQKGIISEVMKKVMESVAQGRGVIGVSLPVRIFETRSMIERILDWWSYTPVYLSPSAQLKDPIERMKSVIAFAFAGLHVSTSQLKPFNPLLGETFEACFPDGTQVYCEHTSHHPPISNFYLVGRGYKFYGRYEYVAKGNATYNVISLQQEGPSIVQYDDGQKIIFSLPGGKLSGMLMGDRLIKWHGNMRFEDAKNRIRAIVKLGAGKKSGMFSKKRTDLIEGKLYVYKEMAVDSSKKPKSKKDQEKEELKFTDLDKEIATISGSWLERLIFGKDDYWNIDVQRPLRHIPVENPLPSDARFREDLLWLKYGDNKSAEKWKLKLEERQRLDRKLRADRKAAVSKKK